MKLLRYIENSITKPGILDTDGGIRDASSLVSDWNGLTIVDESLNKIRNSDLSSLSSVDPSVKIAPCIGDVKDFICIGLNFSEHAAEVKMDEPSEPIVFMKTASAIAGPYDDVQIPRNSSKTDYEVELGLVIGKEASYISPEESEDYIAGYCLVNDISERAFQLERLGQWVKGKSCPGFGPIGPWLVTKDEISDPQNLNMWLDLNGERKQNGNTSTMIHKVFFIVSYLSQFMLLSPGTIISTGTPSGVASSTGRFLKPGDSIRLGVEGLGEQRQNFF
jgi:2-keto-4-pentenoate hydratase/2-oxohepta-3-ene-1,7-dioic acid hydratase in catechol pathway|tara:strand:- start:1104 stop:1934 length:831 start_codon:yes stop_codon:yes gene_type:complete